MKFFIRAAFAVMVLLFFTHIQAGAAELSKVIFKPENLPKGWVMTQNYLADKSKLPEYEKKFNITPLKGLSNQVFIVENRCRLQINYIQLKDTAQADEIAKRIFKQFGHINRILQKENIVIEIMTNPNDLVIKDQVTNILLPVKVIK